VPEESDFEGSILENWELLGDGVIGGNGSEVRYLVKSGFERLKFMVKVEKKELEFKMSYGDKRLKDNVV
jgi:hypothetical protein